MALYGTFRAATVADLHEVRRNTATELMLDFIQELYTLQTIPCLCVK